MSSLDTVHSSPSNQMLIFPSPWFQCNRIDLWANLPECLLNMANVCVKFVLCFFKSTFVRFVIIIFPMYTISTYANLNLCKTFDTRQCIRQLDRMFDSNKFQCMFNVQWSDGKTILLNGMEWNKNISIHPNWNKEVRHEEMFFHPTLFMTW